MASKTGFFRLTDPASSFEIEPGGVVMTGSKPVRLDVNQRIRDAIRIGLIRRVDSEEGGPAEAPALSEVPDSGGGTGKKVGGK